MTFSPSASACTPAALVSTTWPGTRPVVDHVPDVAAAQLDPSQARTDQLGEICGRHFVVVPVVGTDLDEQHLGWRYASNICRPTSS